jgi:hypothetical protein
MGGRRNCCTVAAGMASHGRQHMACHSSMGRQAAGERRERTTETAYAVKVCRWITCQTMRRSYVIMMRRSNLLV